MATRHGAREERVTPLELFFDRVFVFAITQVTGFLSADPTWGRLFEGMLVLAALWWAWAAYAWLTNTLDPEEGAVRIAMLASMAAMLIVSLAVPEAFDDHGVLFGVAYFVVRAMHIALYALAGRGDHDLLGAVLRMTPTSLVGPAIIIAAGFTDGDPQLILWTVALGMDYLGVVAGRGRGWRVSPAHFAERHALIVIIALGESIVAIGVGASGLSLSAGVVAAGLLGIVVVSALWWVYFDYGAIVVQNRLAEARGAAQATLARDAYSYLHLPMVAGIVLFALGLKKTLEHVGDELATVPAVGLCGGIALYLAAHVAIRLRLRGGFGHGKPIAAIASVTVLPVVLNVPALAALAVVAGLCCLLVVYETLRFRERRAALRAGEPVPA